MWMLMFAAVSSVIRNFSCSVTLHTCRKMSEIRRLPAVAGLGDKSNDVIFYGNTASPPSKNVVFFGGDVQDYTEVMLKHRDNKYYTEWNLEATAEIMGKRFPNSHVWVVKPNEKALLTFSIYSNLVPSVDMGNPLHEEGFKSWHHLRKLLCNSAKLMKENAESNNCGPTTNEQGEIYSMQRPLTLVGFSKGCIVLNQLLYDLQEAKEDPETSEFVRNVRQMYWLDGGHNGGSNTWIVHKHLLQHLAGLDLEVHCHVTPYQIKDAFRDWIGKEQKKFVMELRKMGINVTNIIHFEEFERSIDNHFQVLTAF